ncbi:MAG: saccharopine dehydrogenase NADP-binding domain-containing protein [Bacteroidetes bacterium]|nr:saccharopine dehydrogenase NADP-binding domain-containing protein [Bacteroidota bacterium]
MKNSFDRKSRDEGRGTRDELISLPTYQLTNLLAYIIMKKILILGSGLIAKPIIQYLLSKNYKVSVASNTTERSDAMIGGNINGQSVFWDATDEVALDAMVATHDITVSILPYIFHVMVAKHCVAHRKNMVTTSYIKPEMQALDAAAKDAGIIILNEIGLDPGIDHMSAMRIIDNVHQKEGAILEFYSICGALPAPEAARNPFRYKFSWSPKGVVLAGNNDALFLRDGKIVEVPNRDLFKNPFKVNFPEVGALEVYPNRDSLAYREIYGIPEAKTMFRGTFRYQGWCESLDAIKALNLISPEKFDMTGMTYADMVKHQIFGTSNLEPGTFNKRQVAEFLGISDYTHAIQAMEWLGLFDNKPMKRSLDSTFEVTSDLMIEKMSLGETERDMVVMQHTFLAAYSDGRKEVIRSRMLDFGTLTTDTSIARTVALPAAIGVEMILAGKINITGVHIPVIPEIYNPVLDQLEILGIKMVEEYELPLSEMIR